jgi:hypothetical protein
MIARLRPNIAIRQANAEMRGLLKRVVEEPSTGNKAEHRQHIPNFSLESQTIPFREEFTGNVQRPLILLMAAVGIVLVIGCADVTNLMFSRMVARLSGTGIAAVASLLVTRALSALLYDTSPHDLATFIAVPSILALVAFGSKYVWGYVCTSLAAIHCEAY